MPETNRTMFAQQALDMAELFKMSIGAQPVPGRTVYKVELAVPEGPSTGGGVQGVQHITLVPHGGGASIVAGLANKAAQTAELRTHAYLRQQHRRRSPGTELSLDLKAYEELLERMTQFFAAQGITVQRVDATPEPAQLAAPPPPKPLRWVAIGIVSVLAIAGVVIFFLRGH